MIYVNPCLNRVSYRADMKPTTILMDEHRVIVQTLDCLDQIIAEANTRGRLDTDSAADALNFFRLFADQCHHGKEETHLFPAMEAKGFPRENGPTGVMLAEHELGRRCIRQMSESSGGAGQGDPAALRQFSKAGHNYSALLRQHIQKEDHCLFSMADNAFSEQDQRNLMEKFKKVETEEMEPGAHAKLLESANTLAAKYGVTSRVVTVPQ